MCRGVLHLVCAIMLPTVLYFFIRECRGSTLAIVVSTLYVASNTICYGASGLYHIFEWPPEPEIIFQKIDHCGIAMLSVGTILPDAILLFGSDLSPVNSLVGYGYASTSVILCAYTCLQIWRQQPSVALQGLVATWWVLPFMIPNYMYMTSVEFSAMLLTCMFQGMGVLVFLRKAPDPFPSVFGFHEVFHTLVVSAGVCVLIVNYSIVSRYGIAYAQGLV
jgi:hemolysin III